MHRNLRIILGGLAGLAVLGAVALDIGIRTTPLPAGINLPPFSTPRLADIRGRVFSVAGTKSARESEPLTLRTMGDWLPLATVAIEDHRFWQHRGMDFHAMLGAAWRNVRNGRIISGASTITQQLIKNASQRTERTFSAKVYETFASARLERDRDKKKILTAYLNRLDYGNRRIGPEAAARAYFGKSASDLSLPEAIFLAGLPQSPARLNPWKNPAGALARYERNVRWMGALKQLPEGTSVAVLLNNPPQVSRHDPPDEAPHFSQLTWHRHPADAKSLIGKMPMPRIGTTLDLDLQRPVENLLRQHLAALAPFGVGDAAVVVIENSSGHVLALACAGDPKRAAINSATEPRSCGSTLKPFLYLSAIENRRMTASTLLPDTPDAITGEYRDYDPQNYSKHYFGPVRLREALGNSLNVPAVVALSKLGARETFDTLRGWGLDFPQSFDAYGAGFILGNAQVSLLDLAAAYASLARGGNAWRAKLTPRDPIESRPMASPEACAIITDILCDNQARLLSFGNASPLHLEQRTAVKTGTSSGFRDGWCVGFNGKHTVAVWAGNLNGKPMAELLAVRSAAPLWAAVMRHLYAKGDTPVSDPKESDSLRRIEVAAETGLIPRAGEKTLREWFLTDTEPVASAETFYRDGGLILPEEYAVWCASPHNRLGATVPTQDFKILFPRDGMVFEFNPHLPDGQQVMPLQSTAKNCQWFLNGKKLAGPVIPLKPGEWHLVATEEGKSAAVRYVVQ